jgi:hypothetical protein
VNEEKETKEGTLKKKGGGEKEKLRRNMNGGIKKKVGGEKKLRKTKLKRNIIERYRCSRIS